MVLFLLGDFKVTFMDKRSNKDKKVCHAWFNTVFTKPTVVLTKFEIDKCQKDKKHKKFPKNFAIHFHFMTIKEDSEENEARMDVKHANFKVRTNTDRKRGAAKFSANDLKGLSDQLALLPLDEDEGDKDSQKDHPEGVLLGRKSICVQYAKFDDNLSDTSSDEEEIDFGDIAINDSSPRDLIQVKPTLVSIADEKVLNLSLLRSKCYDDSKDEIAEILLKSSSTDSMETTVSNGTKDDTVPAPESKHFEGDMNGEKEKELSKTTNTDQTAEYVSKVVESLIIKNGDSKEAAINEVVSLPSTETVKSEIDGKTKVPDLTPAVDANSISHSISETPTVNEIKHPEVEIVTVDTNTAPEKIEDKTIDKKGPSEDKAIDEKGPSEDKANDKKGPSEDKSIDEKGPSETPQLKHNIETSEDPPIKITAEREQRISEKEDKTDNVDNSSTMAINDQNATSYSSYKSFLSKGQDLLQLLTPKIKNTHDVSNDGKSTARIMLNLISPFRPILTYQKTSDNKASQDTTITFKRL